MPKTVHEPPRLLFVSRCSDQLAALQQNTPGLLSATVATADGLTVASTLQNKKQADKLAAMSGSISSLAAALTRETDHGEPGRLVLESSKGHIVSMAIPTVPGTVLTVVTDSSAVLGKLLWSCRDAVEKIAAASASA